MAGNSFPVPAGKKGGGGLFGVSWASTLDQPLELDTAGVYFLSGDATILKYPAALIPKVAFRPVEGPQWPLTLTPEGGYTITDPKLGRILHFPAPGEQHGWSQLPLTAITDRNGNRIDLVYEGTDTDGDPALGWIPDRRENYRDISRRSPGHGTAVAHRRPERSGRRPGSDPGPVRL
jgi:hypothetical protein